MPAVENYTRLGKVSVLLSTCTPEIGAIWPWTRTLLSRAGWKGDRVAEPASSWAASITATPGEKRRKDGQTPSARNSSSCLSPGGAEHLHPCRVRWRPCSKPDLKKRRSPGWTRGPSRLYTSEAGVLDNGDRQPRGTAEGIEAVVLTRRSNAFATNAIAPLTAMRTSGQQRRSRHETVTHFHTTRLCVSWAKSQESGCKFATWLGNRVFHPEKMAARVTNSGYKFSEPFRKPANTTERLCLAVLRSRAFPRRSLLLLRLLTLAIVSASVSGRCVAGARLVSAHNHRRAQPTTCNGATTGSSAALAYDPERLAAAFGGWRCCELGSGRLRGARGGEVGERERRPEEEAMHLRESPADAASRWRTGSGGAHPHEGRHRVARETIVTTGST